MKQTILTLINNIDSFILDEIARIDNRLVRVSLEYVYMYLDYISVFLLGLALGGGLIWYYWRRYKDPNKLRDEYVERKAQLEKLIKEFKK